MPDPALYLRAMILAALASALCVLVLGRWLSRRSLAVANTVCLVALGAGLLWGYRTLQITLAWPPAKGLDRLLEIVLPLAILVEWFSGLSRVPRPCAWLLRVGLSIATGRILLHDSVYLAVDQSSWTAMQAGCLLLGSGATLAAVWLLLSLLWRRREGVSIPFAVIVAIQTAGATVMLAGYVTGGAAALPLAATVAGIVLSSLVIRQSKSLEGVLGVAIVGLFGILFVGRFFGAVSMERALIVLCAPLMCWGTELPLLRGRPAWQLGTIRLVLVLIPLSVVLFWGKRDFDRKTRPLLGTLSHSGQTQYVVNGGCTQTIRSTTSVEPTSVGLISG